MPVRPLPVHHRKQDLRFTDDLFSSRPELAAGVGRCLAAWSRVELTLSRIFVGMVAANQEVGATLWNAFNSDKSKLDAFRSLCAARLKADDGMYVTAALAMVQSFAKTRNKLGHWYWLSSIAIPDGLVLIDPKRLLLMQGRLEDAARSGDSVSQTHYASLEGGFYFYTRKDADMDYRVFSRTDETLVRVATFIESVDTDQYAAAKAALNGDAHLAPFLQSARTPAQGTLRAFQPERLKQILGDHCQSRRPLPTYYVKVIVADTADAWRTAKLCRCLPLSSSRTMDATVDAPDLLGGLPNIARHLGISTRQARHWYYREILPALKLGGAVCARRSTLMTWLMAAEARPSSWQGCGRRAKRG